MSEFDYGVGYMEGVGHNFILALKEEGANFSDGHLHKINGQDYKSSIEELRKEGYKIFILLRNFYIVDDIFAEKIKGVK
ncbi:hypothetical protein [Aneurinibacillus tyrosinisolvens]|uniref:hypothetical protein n=1 Tax=Aneurinibacillus tyrosinisolvens TaxID=1443435 RepID=UPI00063EFF24|nr:hypothetical protein [Aneurinibacillus tyrosinisolvens]